MSKKIKNDVSKEDLAWMEALDRDDLPFDTQDNDNYERDLPVSELLKEIQYYCGKPMYVDFIGIATYRKFYKYCCVSIENNELTFYDTEINQRNAMQNNLTVDLNKITNIKVCDRYTNKHILLCAENTVVLWICSDESEW